MFRSLVAAVLSAALTLPALTVPAAAHQTNYAHRHERSNNGAGTAAAVLGGLTALYLLKRHSDRRDDKRRITEPRRVSKVLPDRCFRRFDTRRGSVRGYGARCLQRSVDRPRLLPAQCITQVRTHRGVRNLYGSRCLRRAGWTSRAARH